MPLLCEFYIIVGVKKPLSIVCAIMQRYYYYYWRRCKSCFIVVQEVVVVYLYVQLCVLFAAVIFSLHIINIFFIVFSCCILSLSLLLLLYSLNSGLCACSFNAVTLDRLTTGKSRCNYDREYPFRLSS